MNAATAKPFVLEFAESVEGVEAYEGTWTEAATG